MKERQLLFDKIVLPTKGDVIKLHLYFKLVSMSIIPYDRDLDILLELYNQGGYSNSQEQEKFFRSCLDKKLKTCIQSIRNTLAKYTNLGVLLKPKNETRFISHLILPSLSEDGLVLDYKVTHAN